MKYLVVHKYGSNNPFLGSFWIPRRDMALCFNSEADAEAARQREIKKISIKPEDLVVDEWEHPEVEEALLKLLLGDNDGGSVVTEYLNRTGMASLSYFLNQTTNKNLHLLLPHWGVRRRS